MRSYQDIVRSWIAGSTDGLSAEERRAVGLIASGTATEDQLAAVGAEFVAGIKAHLPHEVRAAGSMLKADESRANVLTWTYSDETPDRMGDIIRQDGWELANYKRNPVVLWGHAAGFDSVADEPIGRSLDVRVEGNKLVGDILFAVGESEKAARVFALAKSGFVSAGSVGFRPLKTTHVSDEAERSKLGLGRFGVIFEKAELLEFSLCAVPANPNALQQSIKSGAITAADADLLAAQRTEKDWENYVRRKARSFVSMAQPELDAGAVTINYYNGATDAALDALARAIAASHDQLARALTDLGGCIQSLRSLPAPAPKPPGQQAPRGVTSREAEILTLIRSMKST